MKAHRFFSQITCFIFSALCLASPETLTASQEALAHLERIPQTEREIATGYTESGYWTPLLDVIWYGFLAFVLMRFRVPHRIYAFCERRSGRATVQKLLFLPLMLLLLYALTWPLNLYDGFFRETAYGISNQSLTEWMIEHWISVGFATIVFTPLLLVIYWMLKKYQARAWIGVSLVLSAFLVFLLAMTPIVIDPLTNTYKPIEDGPLKKDLIELATENGIQIEDIYTWDTSAQSTAMRAKVTGLLGNARISVNDNLLAGAEPEEVRMVVAHEMGHLVHHHNTMLVAMFVPMIFAGIWLLFRLFETVESRKRESWNITGISDVRALPLVIALYFVVAGLMSVPINGAQRYIEQEADLFALELTGDSETLVNTLVKLPSLSKPDPGIVEEFLFFDHPSKKRRIETALAWGQEHQ